ncbi:pentatricopeptide repeat-containing protein At3g47530 [Curcuma longa]|uniref:pentatricopeptide repeat-containing protein At3g47530 n=1 Tax=Curcuma longa TaxID=136217 RepID=UPI003D9E158F
MAFSRFLQHRPLFHHRPLPPILCLLNRPCSNLSPLGRQPDRRSPPPASGDCIPLINSCSTKSRLLQIHAHLLRSGIISDPTVSTAFLTRAALAPVSDLDYSRLVFRQIPRPNVYQCNALLRGYAESRSPAEALTFYNRMRELGVRGNSFSSSFLLKSCASVRSLPGGRQVHSRVIRDGHQADSVLLTSLMALYASCKECEDARRMFDEMAFRDTVTWNVLISCYVDNRRSKDALHLFDVMLSSENGMEPDDVTCLILLQVCGQLGALDFGKRIHEYASRRGYDLTPNVQNSLVAMYSKCGCVDKASDVFHAISRKTVVSWSAMISGLAMNGYGRDAIDAFGAMQKAGVTPDEHTFTGVLSACSHSGFVDEGSRFFDMMRDKYGIAPNVCHYGCMVDLLGRAGLLDQAYELIAKEKCVRLDARTWRTLLGACRIHGNTELGERVMEHLVELKAQEAGDYVLLLNTYASAGNWDRVAEVRKLMKDKEIQTSPGCSTIELNGEVHEFVVDDDSHPRKGEVYRMLDEITSQLKKAGYIANVSSELHDMDMEDKRSALSCHSEKLAIAFGILATPPGRTLRIAKNLRTCVDCHNFAKFVSFTYHRLVIIRDRSRFHHFKDGHCSCNDYW